MAKVEIIKDTNPIGEITYFVKVDGWCYGVFNTYNEAVERYHLCVENIKNGRVVQEQIKVEKI